MNKFFGPMAALVLLLAGCAGTPQGTRPSLRSEETGLGPTLAYYQMLHRMTGPAIQRERMVLAALAPTPSSQVRMAMVLGHPRGQPELPRAQALLDGVLKANDPAAQELHPLARLLADQYGERLRMENQTERQGQQLRDSQRKVAELQDKLDGLADIERTLPHKPRPVRPAVSGGGK